MKERLIKKLNELVTSGTKKSTLENEIGLPANSLSAVLAGHKEMPDKWVGKIETYFGEPVTVIPASEKTKMVVDKSGLKLKPSIKVEQVATEAMLKLNKDFGEGTVMFFGSKPNTDYKTVSTGSLLLNEALGIGGLPRGRIVEIFGWESSGKTTIALNAIADAQKQGLKCLLVDAENAFDPEYAVALGVDVESLQYCQPSYGEQGFEVADRLMSSGQVQVVIIDSVAAMIPKAELEGEVGDSKMGLHARLMSQVCRKLVGTIAKNNCLCIFINQFRHKIGVTYGSPEVTTGGMALQFYASIRLEVRRSTTEQNSVMNGDVKEGNRTTVKVIKNKCAPPFRQAVFNIMYGTGIDTLGEIIEMAIEKNIIAKAGSWFSYGESKLGQGKDAVRQILADNPDMKNEIETKIKTSQA